VLVTLLDSLVVANRHALVAFMKVVANVILLRAVEIVSGAKIQIRVLKMLTSVPFLFTLALVLIIMIVVHVRNKKTVTGVEIKIHVKLQGQDVLLQQLVKRIVVVPLIVLLVMHFQDVGGVQKITNVLMLRLARVL
jgi:hypothetical protein